MTQQPIFRGVLFGKRTFQEALLRIARDGSVLTSSFSFEIKSSALAATAFVTRSHVAYGQTWSLETRHPAHAELVAVLRTLDPKLVIAEIPTPGDGTLIRRDAPLGHSLLAAFRVLVALLDGPMTATKLIEVVQQRPPAVASAIARLVTDGVLVDEPSGIRYAKDVPAEYLTLVRKIESILTSDTANEHVGIRRKMAFEPPDDGAPRLFESDARLRNLMALAIHGPLYAADLAIIVGSAFMRPENRNYAPFGRGGVVATWQTNFGPAACLNPNHPVAPEFRALLIALEKMYPLAKPESEPPPPPVPVFGPWEGDKTALFGFPIATGILFTVGTLGWTFESLCVAALVGKHRENVKNVLKSLEDESILASDRPRRPGFDVRLVRLDETFEAKAELETVLKKCVEVWPEYANLTRTALASMPEKTHVHLQNRGILPGGKPKKKPATQFSPERRAAVLLEYYALARKHGRPLNSNDLSKIREMGLYARIRAAFGAFADFQEVLKKNGI